MAEAYASVLMDLGETPVVVGRGESSAQRFSEKTGLETLTGGIHANLGKLKGISTAIVATPVDQLGSNTISLIKAGVSRILVEKPAGINPSTVEEVLDVAQSARAEVFVAYNRRFLASTRAARDLIEEDGGATSLRMEFSEFAHRIAPLPTAAHIKENWLYANSTHVLDLGFFLAGFPARLSAHTQGTLDWHPNAAQFVGHGKTETGAAFSYLADWEAAPRWMVEIGTPRRTVTLQPLEALSFRERTGFAVTQVELELDLDQTFKPGLWRQTAAFLKGGADERDLARLADHAAHMSGVYTAILEGGALS
jgi:predicted dehydrogenase